MKDDNKTTLIDFRDDDREIEEKKIIQVPVQRVQNHEKQKNS